MLKSNQKPQGPFLVLRVAGAAYRQLGAWQQAAELEIMRAQFSERGYVVVVRLGTERGLRRLDFLPEPGAAEPYSGDFGGAYTYRFQLQAQRCRLTVTRGACCPFVTDPPAIAPLELTLPAASLFVAQPGALVLEPRLFADESPFAIEPGVFTDVSASQSELVLILGAADYQRLQAWKWSGDRPEAYVYTFSPHSVACPVRVEYLPVAEQIELAGWDAQNG